MFRSENSKRKLAAWIKKIIAYVYMCICFSLFVQYFGYNLRIAIRPISFIIGITILAYLCYVLINHLLVKKTITHKTLLIFEILLLLTLFSQILGDSKIDDYYKTLHSSYDTLNMTYLK